MGKVERIFTYLFLRLTDPLATYFTPTGTFMRLKIFVHTSERIVNVDGDECELVARVWRDATPRG